LIFSLLKIRKKTSAVIAGVLIGVACLWGIAMWQDISPRQLFTLFLASIALIFGIILLAFCLITIAKLLQRLIKRNKPENPDESD